MESAASEGWWFVVGGEPGLALSFFFGDEFGSLASFSGDPLASTLFAGLLAPRHHHPAIGGGLSEGRYRQLTRGLRSRRKHAGAMRFGGVGVPGPGRQNHRGVGQLLVCPAAGAGIERLDQMMLAISQRTL